MPARNSPGVNYLEVMLISWGSEKHGGAVLLSPATPASRAVPRAPSGQSQTVTNAFFASSDGSERAADLEVFFHHNPISTNSLILWPSPAFPRGAGLTEGPALVPVQEQRSGAAPASRAASGRCLLTEGCSAAPTAPRAR